MLMDSESSNDYDLYAFAILCFVCADCKQSIEAPEWYEDCDDEYCYYIARQAESAGWYVAFDKHMACYCPSCRFKRQL
jgi:hypothetical protein